MDLTTIPRYANFVGHRLNAIGIDNVEVAYHSDRSITAVEYCLNGSGQWKTLNENCYIKSGNWSAGNNTVIYCVTGLYANTEHRIETRIAQTYGVWKYSGQIAFKTKDIARISSVANTDFGKAIDINFRNLENGTTKLYVEIGQVGGTVICTRTNLTNNYKLELTKEEWSLLNKHITEETTEIIYVLETNGKYYDIARANIILKSNIYKKENGEWVKAKVYKKNNGWKLTKLFYKVNGVWRNTK